MRYYYSAASMGIGLGYLWHGAFNFPKHQRVTKTITLNPIQGHPGRVAAVPGYGMWNRVGLHNPGIVDWKKLIAGQWGGVILSVAGTYDDLSRIFAIVENLPIAGIEVNDSCPNHRMRMDVKKFPETRHRLFLKLSYHQNPYDYQLEKIDRISLNSVPALGGGLSGKPAQKANWAFIRRYRREGLPVAGCSVVYGSDVSRLADLGCEEIGLGSVMLTNPWLVSRTG